MSAVDMFTRDDRALIFTDAASYDGNGRLIKLADKCHITADGKLAVTGRGNAWFPLAIAKTINGRSIDEIEDDDGEFFETCLAAGQSWMELAGKSFNNVWVVGWSEAAGRPKIAEWSNCPPKGEPRFRMVDSVLAPDLGPSGLAFVHAEMGPVARDNVDHVKLGVTVMEAQRREPGSAEFAAEGQYLVGGHVLLTEVSENGIAQRVVHRWPSDVVGHKIQPFTVAMSRQQRRRMERLAA